MRMQPMPVGLLFRRLVNFADSNECTPLHIAIINGELHALLSSI